MMGNGYVHSAGTESWLMIFVGIAVALVAVAIIVYLVRSFLQPQADGGPAAGQQAGAPAPVRPSRRRPSSSAATRPGRSTASSTCRSSRNSTSPEAAAATARLLTRRVPDATQRGRSLNDRIRTARAGRVFLAPGREPI